VSVSLLLVFFLASFIYSFTGSVSSHGNPAVPRSRTEIWTTMFRCFWSLTLTQFCALLKTVLFCRASETLP